jgi:hypothetical protein
MQKALEGIVFCEAVQDETSDAVRRGARVLQSGLWNDAHSQHQAV